MARILLVEDNEMNRDMLSRRLVKRGYDVAIAVDGEQGVAMARSEAPALILMDMSLPGLDGREATRQIKAELAAGLTALRTDARQLLTSLNDVLARGQTGPPDLVAARGTLGPPLERVRSAGETLRRQAAEAGGESLLADLDRIRSATLRLEELLSHGGIPPTKETAGETVSPATTGGSQHPRNAGAILVVDDNEDNRAMLA